MEDTKICRNCKMVEGDRFPLNYQIAIVEEGYCQFCRQENKRKAFRVHNMQRRFIASTVGLDNKIIQRISR